MIPLLLNGVPAIYDTGGSLKPLLLSGVENSILSNQDFEGYNALPTAFSQMNMPGDTVIEWFQLTDATTDYMHMDGWHGASGAVVMGVAPQPPTGDGFIGLFAIADAQSGRGFDYYEYAAQILDTPWEAGTYSATIRVGATDGTGDPLNDMGNGGSGGCHGTLKVYGLYDASVIGDYKFGGPTTFEFRNIEDFASGNVVELASETVDIDDDEWESLGTVDLIVPEGDPIRVVVFGWESGTGQWYLLIDMVGCCCA